MACGATTTRSVDTDARSLALFLSWLLSKRTQSEMGMSARTFRRLTAKFWSIWPIAPVCDEVHHVVHVDGIWLKRRCVVLIACTRDHIIGWHLARSESARAWAALMARIAPPDVVVTDGGDGFEKARRAIWPGTRVQRCTFHAFEAVKRCTTTRPRTQAGVDLYAIAKGLTGVESAEGAAKWLVDYAGWCDEYEEFLKERAVIDGRAQYRHERLRKARRSLNRLIKARTLFTYLDPELTADGPQQSDRRRREPPDTRGPERAPRHAARPHDQSGVLVLPQQARVPDGPGRDIEGDADRRDDRRALQGRGGTQRARRAR
jgi:hypothetical protein